MKKQLLIILIALSSTLTIKAQWNGTNPIYTDANIGIGTSNPSSRLSVLGGISKLTLSGVDGTFDNIIKYGHKGDLESGTTNVNRWHGIDATITAGNAFSNKLKFRLYGGGSGNAEPIDVMTLVGNGNVGLGTINPSARLSVVGGISKLTLSGVDGTFDNLIKYGDKGDLESGTTNVNRWHGIDATITAGSASSNKLKFRLYGGGSGNTEPIDVMTLLGDGSVGIGTTSPAYKLDVCGTIRAKEVIVNLLGGSDFVFKNEYKLMDLKTLEQFVKTNQHLPEIASEKEMVENGVNVNELQLKLLQKIEELTLYTIEQNKKLEKQNEKIESIVEQNELLKQEIKLLKKK